ncbi:MAG TPA: right-handed parallel beta-helix repeat-containing protein [Trichormus sp.]|jgi:hypothetical protein
MMSVHKRLGLAAVVSLMVGVTWLPRAEASRLLNVTNFGVVGDGKTDNQAALTHVFSMATPQTIVLFPAGVYLHSGRLNVGPGVVVLGSQATLFGTNAAAQSLNIIGNGTEVTGLALQGEPGGDPAIAISGRNETTIKANIFVGFTDDVDVTNSQQVGIENNAFNPGSSGTAVKIASGSKINVGSNTFTGFNPPVSQTGISCNVTDIVIGSGNSFRNLSVGINVSSSKSAVIDKNTFGACQTVIASNGASNMTITNNSCVNGNAFFNGANVGTKGLTVRANTISTFNAGFEEFIGNTDATIASNKFTTVGAVLGLAGDQNTKVTGNTMSNCGSAIVGELDTQLSLDSNTFTNCQDSINLVSETSVDIISNTFTSSDGIKVSNSTNVNVGANRMNSITTQGVFSDQNTGKVQIHENEMLNCGLSASVNPPAVIFAGGGQDLSIVDNIYIGNAIHLQFFIDTPVAGAKVSGNKTTTMLPNKIGP